MPTSPPLRRAANRVALVAAALWWGYAFFSTSFFTNLSATGLAVYLLGLPLCYGLAYLGVLGLALVVITLR